LAGMVGLWGFLLLTLALAAWKIYQGWELFDTSTKWMADKVWGRTTTDYNVFEVLANEQETSRGQSTVDRSARVEGQSNTSPEKPSNNVSEQEHSRTHQETVQDLPSKDSTDSQPRTRSRKRKTLSVVSEDLGTRKQVKQ
jgi:hypothetical protein